jgi:hypothetical protein
MRPAVADAPPLGAPDRRLQLRLQVGPVSRGSNRNGSSTGQKAAKPLPNHVTPSSAKSGAAPHYVQRSTSPCGYGCAARHFRRCAYVEATATNQWSCALMVNSIGPTFRGDGRRPAKQSRTRSDKRASKFHDRSRRRSRAGGARQQARSSRGRHPKQEGRPGKSPAAPHHPERVSSLNRALARRPRRSCVGE